MQMHMDMQIKSTPKDELSSNKTTQNNKTPFLKNFTQFFKKGSNALGEKIGHIFQKKEKSTDNVNRIGEKFAIVKESNINSNMNNKLNENKQIFKIEEDEEGKEKIYHLEDDDDEDDEDDDDDIEDDDYDQEDEINQDKLKASEKIENCTNVLSQLNANSAPDSTIDTTKASIDEQIKKIQESSRPQTNSNPLISTNNLESESTLDYSQENYDTHAIVHRIYYKGSLVNITDHILIKFLKIKNKSNILSFMGISKKLESKKYLAFFDENYLYFLKDIEVDKKDKNVRKIGNKINLNMFYNASIDNLENNGVEYVHIRLEFLKEYFSDETFIKDLYFEEKHAEGFVHLLDLYLRRLNIQLFEEDENNTKRTKEEDKEINEKEDEQVDEESEEEEEDGIKEIGNSNDKL